MNPGETEERIPRQPPLIRAIPAGMKRPVWSVMIPVYNCSDFLRETLESVLLQDTGIDNMQIAVVDDASTDADVEKIVREAGGGRITYFRQPQNVGSLRNFQTCIDRSRGQFVHILHGDDRVKDGFYRRFALLFQKHPEAGAGFCRYAYIDARGKFLYNQEPEMAEEGILQNWLARLGERQRIQYVSMVVRRAVYEKLGSFYGVEYGEDWEMWMRIASQYKTAYIPDVLAEYRRHFASISGKSFLTGRNMQELTRVMDRIQHYLPGKKRSQIMKRSKKFYAHYALRTANTLWKDLRHKGAATAQARAAWGMNQDIGLFYKILKLYTRMTLNL
jgi:glycosyltransferase involved in cell wall biosynthesis